MNRSLVSGALNTGVQGLALGGTPLQGVGVEGARAHSGGGGGTTTEGTVHGVNRREGFTPGVRRHDEGLPLNPTQKQSRDSLPNPEMDDKEYPLFTRET